MKILTTQTKRVALPALIALTLALAACGGDARDRELEELRARLERLEHEKQAAQSEEEVTAPPALSARFAEDPVKGTLAGLAPGDSLERARELLGPEDRTRAWDTEDRKIVQYEWDLEAGLSLRVNANQDGQVEKIAVVLVDPQAVRIPTLAGLTIGGETFASVEEKFRSTLKTNLHIWGADGLYTVAQRTHYPPDVPDSRWQLEFAYQMPDNLGQALLDQIEEQVQRRGNPAVLEPYLAERAPYMLALEEIPRLPGLPLKRSR